MWTAIFTIWTAITPITAAASGPAGHEFNFEAGTIGVVDPSWAMFSETPAIATWGFRGGVQIAPWTRIIGGWQHGTRGREITFEDSTTGLEVAEIHTAATVDQYSLGGKVIWEARPWLHPYATAQGVLFVGHIRLDDDVMRQDNENQLRFGAVAPGMIGAIGTEVLPFGQGKRVRMAAYLELGYGHAWPMRFRDRDQDEPIDVGNITVNGLATRFGVGVRF